MNDNQLGIFGDITINWEKEWRGMPEFIQEDLSPTKQLIINFESEKDYNDFAELIGQKLTLKTQSVWYPEAEIGRYINKRYSAGNPINPKYPIYIPSKGRWESRLTSKALEKINVPYYIVVEPQEYDNYAAVINPEKILVLPEDNIKLIGSRNWIWEHSISEGYKRHWQIDDNIKAFYRLNRNLKVPVSDGSIFQCAENFTDRYENIAQSGLNYFMFACRKDKLPPYYLNTRIYSCTLNNNIINYRYRSIYNDDTDMSLRVLKDGWCTVLFNTFLCEKAVTMTMKGGNTEDLYLIKDGRKKMAEALQELHPDCVQVIERWGRWQHYVDYSKFKRNKLILKPDIDISEGVNNYGMELKIIE